MQEPSAPPAYGDVDQADGPEFKIGATVGFNGAAAVPNGAQAANGGRVRLNRCVCRCKRHLGMEVISKCIDCNRN